MSKKVGIMGGTFNPIHCGHLILAETARNQYKLDEILFIPSGISYMKKDLVIPTGEIRAEMTSLAIEDNPFFALSMLEVERQGNTYTYETLKELRRANPDVEYFFILGADSLFAIDNWRKPEEIFLSCTILVAVRDDKGLEDIKQERERLLEKYQGNIKLLKSSIIEISSSNIRKMLKEGESIRYLVPDKVIDYIQKQKLYV